MRQLRDTRQLKSLLKAGETIELVDRNKPLARITPIGKPASRERVWPDFEGRLKSIFGNRVLNSVDEFIRNRHGRY